MSIEYLTDQAFRVLMYDDEEEYGEILEALSAYLTSYPRNANAQNNLGVAYRELGQAENAQQAFDAAIQADPQNPIPYINKGDLYKQHGAYQQAIEYFTKAINLKGDVSYYLCRGYTLIEMNLFHEALKDFDVALNLDPQHRQTKITREQILKKMTESKHSLS